MPCPPEPDRYCPPCGHYTCSDKATEAGCFCADHWWMLPEYLPPPGLFLLFRSDSP